MLAVDQVFHGRYKIVRCLQAGGMGAVYECVHLTTQKHRALKVMLPQVVDAAEMRGRFELEARVTAAIESEHIVETFDAGIDEATGAPFLVMELLRGEDLASIVKKRGRLSREETVTLLSQAAMALDRTHAAGIIHRDLKPDNLFVTTHDDGSPRMKILDFGIAKVVADATKTIQQTAIIGTPPYMSREQILGEGTIGPQADIYALAHIAFTLLVGKPYWSLELRSSGAVFAFLGKVVAGAPEPATVRAARYGAELPPEMNAWFSWGTAALATDRCDRASALIQGLATALGVAPAERSGMFAAAQAAPGAVAGPAAAQAPGDQSPMVTASRWMTVPLAGAAPVTALATSVTGPVALRQAHAPSSVGVARAMAIGAAALSVLVLVAMAVLRISGRGEAPAPGATAQAVTMGASATASQGTAAVSAAPPVSAAPGASAAPPVSAVPSAKSTAKPNGQVPIKRWTRE